MGWIGPAQPIRAGPHVKLDWAGPTQFFLPPAKPTARRNPPQAALSPVAAKLSVFFLRELAVPCSVPGQSLSVCLAPAANLPLFLPPFEAAISRSAGRPYSTKSEDDVYNTGFILLESLVGPIVTGKGGAFLLNEMTSFGSQDGMRKIVDPIVLTTSSQESLSTVISLTNKCILPESSSRPSFEDVLWNLQYAAQVQATADSDQKSDTTSQSELQLR
ncbi:Leucine-rich repeat protein kinase family protein [Abeliophyllum distichum]|uniref:Leucine-rich repeat protein kinase family protein n=1 Tax=Abeliophyllum distichum TaxID=126358 RepID=A0ABD1SI04_9LAMI